MPRARADVWLDLSAPVLDIKAVNRALRLRATHWYTPEGVAPPDFAFARATALPAEQCCWQYRVGLVRARLPSGGVARLVGVLSPRARVIRELCRALNIEPEINVWFERGEAHELGPYVWLGAPAIALCAKIGARVVVSVG